MRKRLLLPLIFLMLFLSCYQVERNCEEFRTGTFRFDYQLNGVTTSSTFSRTEDYNIDYINGVADSSSIRWINDCEFILKKLNPKTMAEEKAIHMKILSTTDSSYAFEYKLAVKDANKEERVEKGIAIRIGQ